MISRGLTCAISLAILSAVPAAAQEKPAQTEFYPLTVGSQWTYRVGSQPVSVRVAKLEEIEIKKIVVDPQDKTKTKEIKEKVQGYQLESRSDDRVQSETVVVLADGVYRASAAGKEITPPVCFLKLPARAGETWKVESTTEGMPVRGTFTISQEEIEVPLFGKQKFAAFKSSSEDFQMGKHRLKLAYWFARDYGLVMQRVEGGNIDVTMKLEAHDKAAK